MKLGDIKNSPGVYWTGDSPQGWALTECGWKVGIEGDSLVAAPPKAEDKFVI